MRNRMMLLLSIVMFTAGAQAADSRAALVESVRAAFDVGADEIFMSEKEASELREEMPYASSRMVVTKTQRATLHQVCMTSESRFVMLESFRPAANDLRARFDAFLIENLQRHGVDAALTAKLPVPVSASVEKVNCFTDASDAVLGLIYQEAPGRYFKIEIAVADFN